MSTQPVSCIMSEVLSLTFISVSAKVQTTKFIKSICAAGQEMLLDLVNRKHYRCQLSHCFILVVSNSRNRKITPVKCVGLQ